ncbi:hypothetical protein QM588_05155 [Rhodococcus sp. IEGM 1354]|uniref:hypothetical protein n=1 Tax=Rhodococcus sp. IEGM 1354 TaxID=3047088 RepID=UPI0024B8512D|nr:hypothetical protein [Rhodococcus sp. IEGM 1354]MDI9929785.1 hypothetical protein [Rhodococcus sp. IEGM 1354]
MRKTATAVLAAATAIPLALSVAAPAWAVAGGTTAVFTTTVNENGSNTVTGVFKAPEGDRLMGCAMGDFTFGTDSGIPLYDDDILFGSSTPTLTLIDTDVPDGTYVIDWTCFQENGIYEGSTNYDPDGVAPTILVVPESVEPELPVEPGTPESGCTGSVCLPSGSFGL